MANNTNTTPPNPVIYVLELEGGKYYVGKTHNLEKRLEEHQAGEGSAFTRRHTPVSVNKIVRDSSAFAEDKITKDLMAEYGIDNVRGGSYVQEVLSPAQRSAIEAEMKSATNACFRCGSTTHYASKCFATLARTGVTEEDDQEEYQHRPTTKAAATLPRYEEYSPPWQKTSGGNVHQRVTTTTTQ